VKNVMNEAEETRIINSIAVVNLIAYALLSVIILGLILILPLPLLFLALLYPLVGIACSRGLLQHKKWAWYTAMVMWIGEGILLSIVSYLNTRSHTIYLSDFIFVFFAVLRVLSIAYLTGKRTRASFDIERQSS